MLRPVPVGKRILGKRKFPVSIDGAAAFDDAVENCALAGFAPDHPFITRQTNIITIGSCFAQNIARAFFENNYNVTRLNVGERLFNPFALQDFTERLVSPDHDFSAFVEHWSLPEEQILAARQVLTSGAVVIITLGLSFVWYDNTTEEIIFDPMKKVGVHLLLRHPDRYEMRATGVPENTLALKRIVDALRRANPLTKVIFTLSPLPMSISVCDYPVAAADAISKATLRCALHEITKAKLEEVYYYPSYEVLRGMASMVDLIWFEDGLLSHIRRAWTDYALSKFMAAYCEGEQALPPPLKA